MAKENNADHIDFLKIDVDGYDFEVIKGAGDFINKIKYIQFEDFKGFVNGKFAQDVFDYLKDWNVYELYSANIMNYVLTKEKIDFLPKYREL